MLMLDLVEVGSRTLASYQGIAPDHLLEELRRAAAPLRGVRVLHVNATPYGGGVPELLRSVVPLLDDLGIVAHWRIIRGENRFFDVTKAMHNGLQGAERGLTPEQQATYLEIARRNARAFDEQYDFVFVHDPQPAALLSLRGKGIARWIWRCHIDTSEPNPQVWNFLRPFLADYDAAIFTMPEFAPADVPTPRIEVIPPAIDPCSPKNLMCALAADRFPSRDQEWGLDHDLVCGMSLGKGRSWTAVRGGVEYGFCSARCRSQFLDRPERYVGARA